MEIKEPKVEVIELEADDIVTKSDAGTSLDVCQGTSDNSCPTEDDWL